MVRGRRGLKRLLLGASPWLVAMAALGGQSVTVDSGAPSVTLPAAAPWTTIGSPEKSMRWELRIHDFGADWPQSGLVFGPLQLYNNGGGMVWAQSNFNGDTIGNNGVRINGCCSGRTDVLIRVQRDVEAKRYTMEVCDTTGGKCLSGAVSILSFGPTSWAGFRYILTAGHKTAFLRWFSSAVPLGTPIPIAGTAGDLGNWEFDGNLTDTSGRGLNLAGGAVRYADTPVYPPNCDAGRQQSIRAGHPATLDASNSKPLDGGTEISYLWQQLTGPSTVEWSTRSGPRPEVSGMVFGSYVFQATVTDGSNQSRSCTVKHGAVATDDNGVVLTGNAAVDTLLGPMVRFGANPWPWFDDRHKVAADLQIANLDQYYGAYWDVAAPGTVAAKWGSNIIAGTGTTFTTTFCQGPENPGRQKPYAGIVVWYPTGISGQTGRRQIQVTGCQSDTQLTVERVWAGGAAEGEGFSYAMTDNSTFGLWANLAAPVNYYDNVAAFYALYYRSGIDDYLTAARKLADRFWTCPQLDRGNACALNGNVANCFPPRALSMMGLVLRALDGRPDMWPGLRILSDTFMWYLTGPDLSWGPGTWDTREEGYHVAMVSYCALFDIDPEYRSKCKAALSKSLTLVWKPYQIPDGSWPQLYATHSSWSTNTSVTLTNGSTEVVGNGTTWTAGQFATGYVMWFLEAAGRPTSNEAGDPTVYTATFIDATHLRLDRPYEGRSGTHGWAGGTGMIGWGTQPFMLGILGSAFDLAARALADTDPEAAALARKFNVDAAMWLKTYGYRPATKGMYYFAGGANCKHPIGDSAVCGGQDASASRTLSAEALRAVMTAYASNKDPELKAFGDTLYSAMFSKPGSGGPESDGQYIDALDTYYLQGTPPPPKWFGMFFGFSALSAWPAHRIGGAQPQQDRAVYVGFAPQGLPGAVKARVTITEPSGKKSQTECASSPCAVTVDARQGTPLLQIQYLSATDQVVGSGRAAALSGLRF